MSPRRTKFYRDKLNSRWFGVCAGIADYTGLGTRTVRLSMVVLTVLTFPIAPLFYIITGFLAPVKPIELYEQNPDQKKFWQGVRSNPRRMARDVRSRFRELDRRLAEVETYVTSSNSRLAREIDQLR